jgi:hypothetical protein
VVVLRGQLGHDLVAAGHGVHGHHDVNAAQRLDGALDAVERRTDGQPDERLVPLGAHALDRRRVGPQRDGGLVRHHPHRWARSTSAATSVTSGAVTTTTATWAPIVRAAKRTSPTALSRSMRSSSA